MKITHALLGAKILLTGVTSAAAHTAYMKPTAFDVTRARAITLMSSFTDDFSNPEIGVKSEDWHYIAPNGVRYSYDNVLELKQVTVLENTLPQEGTYRFTSGERLGRVGKMIRTADGAYKMAVNEDGNEVSPGEGETLITSQTATVSDVYVSKGAPTQAAIDSRIGRLVFAPVTHPNEIYLDEGFELDILFDGAPLADQELELVREAGAYAEDKGAYKVSTDENGRLSLRFDQPGVYLLMTRHRADAPKGAETDIRSYTTSLTFEVTR